MFYYLEGKVAEVEDKFIVLDVGGVGYKISTAHSTTTRLLAQMGALAKIFIHYHLRENAVELFGFLQEEELRFFEIILSVSGVGPKSALSVLDLATVKDLKIAISSGKPELLGRASGIGKKIAERIVLELKPKFIAEAENISGLEKNLELEEALISLGYQKNEIRQAFRQLPEEASFQQRLKMALKILGRK